MCQSSEQSLPPGPRAPAQARRFVAERLAQVLAGHESLARTIPLAELLVSELASNAVKAGARALTVHLAVHHGWFQLAVADDASGEPRLADPDPTGAGGRGLLIVHRVATNWGTHSRGGSKAVWCRLDLPEHVTAELDCRVRGRHQSEVPADHPAHGLAGAETWTVGRPGPADPAPGPFRASGGTIGGPAGTGSCASGSSMSILPSGPALVIHPPCMRLNGRTSPGW